MRVLLITQKFKKTTEKWMPLGLCYIASSFRANGHLVKIFDRQVMGLRYTEQELNIVMRDYIKEFNPNYIGLSAVSPLIYDSIETIRNIRKVYNKKIFMGGHHVTAFPVLTLERIPELDAVIVGEGERSAVKYVEGRAYNEIAGLYWREGSKIKGNDRDIIDNLDCLPLPAYDLLDMDYYLAPSLTIRGFYLSAASLMSSRGCSNNCSYCTESLTFSQGVRFHSVGYVIQNIEYLIENYPVEGLTFLDNNFLASRAYAESLLEKLIAKGLNKRIRFCIQARVSDIDYDITLLLKNAGCIKIELGIESNKQELLDKMGKNTELSVSETAVRICNKVGISVQGNMIHGYQGETIEDLKYAFSWIKGLKLDNFKWGLLKIFPGSRLYQEQGKNYFEENKWDKDTITVFFSKDHLSSVPELLKDKFFKIVRGYNRRRDLIVLLKNNSIKVFILYLMNRIKGRLLEND